jgi:DNA invertase Pin-like site-specific DNA recombinase
MMCTERWRRAWKGKRKRGKEWGEEEEDVRRTARQGKATEGRALEDVDKLGKNKNLSHTVTEKAKFKTIYSEK